MSAAPVPVTYPCGCCPDMGVYCAEARPLAWAVRMWVRRAELSEIARDEPEVQLRNEGFATDAEKLMKMHLAGRW